MLIVGLEDIVEEAFICSPHQARPIQVAQRKESSDGYAPGSPRSGSSMRLARAP